MSSGFILDGPALGSLNDYIAMGGGRGLAAAKKLSRPEVIAELAASGIRGRGGAGFPVATKWRSVAGGPATIRYAVCNAAEGEPATFKDRAIMRSNPYQVVEGVLIAAHTLDVTESYIALKASFTPELERIETALAEMADAGWIDRPITVVRGPEEYLFGEEKALLEVIEGNEPLPRWLPPYIHGLFSTAPQLGWQAHDRGRETDYGGGPGSHPTLVNNVETLSNVAHIMANGAEWFREFGTEESPGTICCTVIGDVVRAGVHEVQMGTPLSEVLEMCGGVADGRTVKAVFSGVSNRVLRGDQIETPLTYEDFAAAGSGLGAAGFVVYDDSTTMVEVAAILSRFLSVESCGQCPPCKLGSVAITTALETIVGGQGTDDELDTMHRWLQTMTDGSRCYLPTGAQLVVSSLLQNFPGDFVDAIDDETPIPLRGLQIPKILDIVDGVATFDQRQMRKRPDWTYDED